MINLLLCKKCSNIISVAKNIKYFSSTIEIISLKTLPQMISIESNANPTSSLDSYDLYCVYSAIFCKDCNMPIGKKYLTFNQYLLDNCIDNVFFTPNILRKDCSFVKNINETHIFQSKELLNFEVLEGLNKSKCKLIPFSQSILVLSRFLDSEFVLQKKKMKAILKRIKCLEDQSNEIILLISQAKMN